jgi:hypothetical protein
MKLEMPKMPKLPKLSKGSGKSSLSSVEMPKVVTDLYEDLKDRHLLPLVAVLLIAIPAAPILLDGKGSEPAPAPSTAGLPSATGKPAQLTVVSDNPGLRDYRRRLGHLQQKNPFKQHFMAPRVAGANLGTTTTTSTTSSTSTTSTSGIVTNSASGGDLPSSPPATGQTVPYAPAPGTPGADTGNSGGGHGPTKVKVETKFVHYEVDVRAGVPGKTKKLRGVHELQMLPSQKNPVAVFMGVSGDGKRAMFLVSSEVTSTFGDVRCGFGDSSCQLVELTPGIPVTFTYGAKDKRYQINVLKLHKVVRDSGKDGHKHGSRRHAEARVGSAAAR